jgi:formylglycine-generating enzyme required for sulfatase activity
MVGNAWERTIELVFTQPPSRRCQSLFIPENPRGTPEDASYGPCMPDIKIARMDLKRGAHLCAPDNCRRHRPAACRPEPVDTSTSHVGFRCIVRPAPSPQ